MRIFEFDTDGRLRSQIEAGSGQVQKDGQWRLREVQRADWPAPSASQAASPASGKAAAAVQLISLPQLDWPSSLDAGVVAAALLPVQTMSTLDLWRYTSHLADQDQAVQRQDRKSVV